MLDPQGGVILVAGGAGGQAGAWDASRQAAGEMSSTHGGHGGGEVGGDGGTTPCNDNAVGGGGGSQTSAGNPGGSNRGYDPGQPGSGHNGGDGGGFSVDCHITDPEDGSVVPASDAQFEDLCDDTRGCAFTPASGHPKVDASCDVEGTALVNGRTTTQGGWGYGTGGRGETVPCDGGGGGGGGGWFGGGGGGGACHGTGGGGGSGYVNSGHAAYIAGGSIQVRLRPVPVHPIKSLNLLLCAGPRLDGGGQWLGLDRASERWPVRRCR